MSVFWSRADQSARNARALSTEHLMGNLRQRTASGGLIAVGSQGVRMVLQIAQAGLLSRLLDPVDFGLMAMAMSITGFISIFSDPGLSAATVQRKDLDQGTVSALFFTNLAMGILVMFACIAAAPLAALFFHDARIKWLIIGLAVTIPLGAAGAQHNALLTRSMRWGTIQWTTTATQVVGLTVSVLLAWKTNLDYWALVAAGWATAIVGLVLVWETCGWRPSRVTDWSAARSSINFGMFLTGFHFVDYFNRQFDNILVGWRWGAIELGFYSRAYTLLYLPLNLINGPVGSAVVPALSRLQNDPPHWRKTYLESLGLVTLLGSVLGAGMIATAGPLVQIVFGEGWEKTALIFQCLAFSMIALTPMSTVGWIYLSLGQTDRLLRWSCLSTPFVILCFFIGLPFGGVGMAVAYSVSMFLLTVPGLRYAAKNAPLTFGDIAGTIGPFLLSGMVAAAVGISAESAFAKANVVLKLIGIGSVTLCVYLLLTFLFFLIAPRTRFICSMAIAIVRRTLRR